MNTFFCPVVMAAVCFVAAMLNDKRDLARRKREDAEDAAAGRPPCRPPILPPSLPMSAFGPGSIR